MYRYYCHPYLRNNPYPEVNTDTFQQSLQAYQTLFEHGKIVINQLMASPGMRQRLMQAAQRDDHEEVDRVIKSTGVPSVVETSYTPSSVTFTLHADADSFQNCCTLTMNLVWGFF
ncbi:hypothetical protein MUO14_16365 [Halobacillus shinanisalinarum]|uniref:Uncharacterized protein n=1 Tax=Halobacillus shinanisalinarum TaxID=2932258 RepID=A0ABY4GWG3_9BACI|nr:hypothetical protein [Halobacillus shinanisalinarum]UOQ92060.1 hypothetical protein MUO14_16365 [Halobacillus shinanisalinarum]